MQLQKVIEQLGYTANEAKVYLAALSLGEAHISDIAVYAKLPRSTAQAMADKLHAAGLMNFYVQRRYKYWVADSPERILSEYKKREERMREALPALIALRRKKSKRRLREIDVQNSKLLRMSADAALQPLLITNEDAEIVYANKPWRDLFGYSLEEIAGENPRMFQSGKTPREVFARMWQALREERMFQSDEIVDRKKDGENFNLLTTIFPLRLANAVYFVQILDDISARGRARAAGDAFVRTMVQ
jgi:PAS domain S-box-containing protein